ncbi:MAG: hypothetical protein LWW92_11675 [Rhodocyclales bacterium]|nr:hypothetical protein [Rhodocyclales bacterium]
MKQVEQLWAVLAPEQFFAKNPRLAPRARFISGIFPGMIFLQFLIGGVAQLLRIGGAA